MGASVVLAMITNRTPDPYRACHTNCGHDLAPGVLVSDLLRSDGPHRATAVASALVIGRSPARTASRVELARAG